MEALLHKLASGTIFTAKEFERALGRLNWATSSCPLSKPFLQFLLAWKAAVSTSGRPSRIIRSFAKLWMQLLTTPLHAAQPL